MNVKHNITATHVANGYYIVKCLIHNNVLGVYCERQNHQYPNAKKIVINNKTLYYFSNIIEFIKLAN